MSYEWKSKVTDCWCGTEHEDPLTELLHVVITELHIPELAAWLEKQLTRGNRR